MNDASLVYLALALSVLANLLAILVLIHSSTNRQVLGWVFNKFKGETSKHEDGKIWGILFPY